METSSRSAPVLSILVLCGLVAAVALWAIGGSDALGPDPAAAAALEPFDSCEEVEDYVDDHRWALGAGPYGPDVAVDGDVVLNTAEAAPTALTREVVGPSATGTNVQEAGIDEPDITKLDGDTLYVLSRGALQAFDVSSDEPFLLDQLELGGRSDGNAQLLIAGDTALVIDEFSARPDWLPQTRLTEIDVTDPAAMAPRREMEIDGANVSARLRGSTAHVVLAGTPDYRERSDEPDDTDESGEPEPGTGASGETGPEPEPDDESAAWLPQVTVTELETGEASSEPLFGCDAVSYPERFAGLGLVSVLTLDLAADLAVSDVDTVITNGHTVYASASSLYVATEALAAPSDGVIDSLTRMVVPDTLPPPAPAFPDETQIHRFDTTDPLATSYSASGEVDGRILNEWSLSEHEGFLRVATMTGDSFVDRPGERESGVTVLAERDGQLETVGAIDGLGRGEEIFGVRFVGEMGYVVTFEQTDPLYALDLSSPEAPELTGELKIRGYSAYLHPVADGRLLGIGQSGTQDGTLTGAQASLFDVADAGAPERMDTLDLVDKSTGTAAAEWDHHAFLYSPENALAVVPVATYELRGTQAVTTYERRGSQAVAMRVDPAGGLTELARLDDGNGEMLRTLVAGDRLVTVSSGGVASRDLETLE